MSEQFLSVLFFALIATLSPGGATTLATASGAQFGLLRSLPLLSGIAVGLGLLVGAVAAGLGAALQSRPELELWLRIGGSAYLLWLAWMIGRQAAPGSRSGAPTAPLGLLSGLVLLWTNPKAWSMAAAAASAYSGLSRNPLLLAGLCGVAFSAAAFLSLAVWCGGGAWLARIIRSDRQWRAVNLALAALLAASVLLMWR